MVLREWEEGDLAAMVGLFDDPDVAYWTPLVSPFDLEAARVYLKRAQERRAAGKRVQLAVTVDGGEPMGEVLLMLSELNLDVAEIGYAVGAAYRGRGLAARAVRVMTGFARDTVGVSRLLLEIEAENAASAGVARAARLSPDGGAADPGRGEGAPDLLADVGVRPGVDRGRSARVRWTPSARGGGWTASIWRCP
ncbi:GNAT family N-acetyltransferase [Streptosporangium lutulentum]